MSPFCHLTFYPSTHLPCPQCILEYNSMIKPILSLLCWWASYFQQAVVPKTVGMEKGLQRRSIYKFVIFLLHWLGSLCTQAYNLMTSHQCDQNCLIIFINQSFQGLDNQTYTSVKRSQIIWDQQNAIEVQYIPATSASWSRKPRNAL